MLRRTWMASAFVAQFWLVLSGCVFWSTDGLAQGPNTATQSAIDIQQTPIFQPSVQQTFRTLARPLSVLWRDQSLKPGLRAIETTQGVEIFLDRRIDPAQPVQIGLGAERVDILLNGIANGINCKLGFIESVAYLGPTEETARIEMTYWRAWYQYRKQLIDTKAPGDITKAPQIPVQRLHWDRLTTPQDILSSIEREWNIEILGKENVPHDLWDEGKYSALTLPAQICLVVAGFGLSAEPIPASNQWKLIPIRDSSTAVLGYAKNQWKRENLEQWSKSESLDVTEEAKQYRVRADVATHYAIALGKYQSALPKPKSRFENLRFTFEAVNTPAADVIDSIAIQLQLQADWQIDRGVLAQRRIGLKVNQATVKQLIEELAKQSSVSLEVLNETTLMIKP